ncbi:glycosyltransferase family 2 protein [Bacteroides clarus]|uniref:glycosyltransferase family 2 protein n=1 Tax=Bacteroides clarus TaxID=626929 RepID=UPI0024B07EC4|nr:glycosyltransferase family 2 protein [Bacteroides clarus]
MLLHSIIIPVYNSSQYLKECIDSILCQKENAFEVLLIDDGSTDDSGKICDEYSQKDARVKSFHILNGGVSKARNYGISKAKGQYISFVDSDDFVARNYLQIIQSITENHPDFAIYNYTRWISSTKYEIGRFRLIDGVYHDLQSLYQEAVNLEIVSLSVCCAVFRRNIIEAHHIHFDENMKTCEDFMFSLAYYQHIQSFMAINTPIYYYRQNLNSATGKRALQHGLDYQIVFKSINDIFNSRNFPEEIINTFQRRWTRWIIALVSNYKNQKIKNEDLETVIYSQPYYATMIHFIPQNVLHNIELWLLKKKYSKSIATYCSIIIYLKHLLRRYKL